MEVVVDMLKETCPGSREIRTPYPEELECIFCGHGNEVWSDEPDVVCGSCGRTVTRNLSDSCIMWCKAAKECVGADKYERLMKALNKD
jgi:hypothetical protein